MLLDLSKITQKKFFWPKGLTWRAVNAVEMFINCELASARELEMILIKNAPSSN